MKNILFATAGVASDVDVVGIVLFAWSCYCDCCSCMCCCCSHQSSHKSCLNTGLGNNTDVGKIGEVNYSVLSLRNQLQRVLVWAESANTPISAKLPEGSLGPPNVFPVAFDPHRTDLHNPAVVGLPISHGPFIPQARCSRRRHTFPPPLSVAPDFVDRGFRLPPDVNQSHLP